MVARELPHPYAMNPQPAPVGDPIYPIGAVARLEGDRRYPGPRLCRILENRAFPVYHARVSDANASQAPGEYDTKHAATAITHSKLSPVK